MDLEQIKNLVNEITKIGIENPSKMNINNLSPFKNYFNSSGILEKDKLNEIDGLWTRREILTRYLLISSVLDQGPDLEGVRLLLNNVLDSLYKKKIRILHNPLEFFNELGISIDEILNEHNNIKDIRAKIWAEENQSTQNKYNLFTDKTNQVLGYAIYRWGSPLCLPYLLEKDLNKSNKKSFEPLVEYIEKWESAEIMSQQIKDNSRYGLGKAIGDKATHLFAKFYIHTFDLVRENTKKSFNPISYELPFDSNAGRVLFRTGFLLYFASIKKYKEWEVIQEGKGKGGKNYIRVTNIRGKKSNIFSDNKELMDFYEDIVINYLKLKKRRPLEIEIQHTPNILLLLNNKINNNNLGIGNFDDGLIFIGTNYCFNHDEPNCQKCPINQLCSGYIDNRKLISEFRT